MERREGRRVLGGMLALALLAATGAGAAITTVELSLGSVQSLAGSESRLVRFEGAVLGSELVQIDYPLHLVLVERATGRYVRFDVSAGAVTGTAPQLLDGPSASESLALLAEGEPLAGGEVAFVGAGRVDVRVPAGALSGPLDAYAFALYRGEALMSNPLPVEELAP